MKKLKLKVVRVRVSKYKYVNVCDNATIPIPSCQWWYANHKRIWIDWTCLGSLFIILAYEENFHVTSNMKKKRKDYQ